MVTTTNHNNSNTPDSEKDRWRTPGYVFDYLAARYGPFDLDVAADESNRLCPEWLGPGSPYAEDALSASWLIPGVRKAWCNPPYSRGWVEKFARKAYEQYHRYGIETTLLIPANVDAPWFHQFVWANGVGRLRKDVDLIFFPQRIRFLRPDGTPAGTPTFPSMAVTFGLFG